jgi:predicted Zn-dependent protease
MRRKAAVFLLLAALAACVRNPYTGRRQFIAISEAEEAQLGRQAYQEVLAQERISTDPAEVGPVRRVGQRLAAAAGRPEFQWEFNVIVDDKTLNAWCLPGGKIAFYTGIFPVLQDEAGMAFVMGHEIAHALLRHGAERLSEGLLVGGVGALLGATLGRRDESTRQGVLAAYGVLAQVGFMLPHSRAHETEADREGLKLMARAGYDPRQAVEVWRRMQKMSGGGPPEFLSTHPSHETRIEDLERHMPEALALYEAAAKAPVAALPAIPGNRAGTRKDAEAAALTAGAPAASGVAVRPLGSQRGATEEGRKAVAFEFAFDRDAYVHEVRIEGPGGAKAVLEARAGVPGGARRIVLLQRAEVGGPDLPAGRYVLRFRGAASGRRFEAEAAYTVP